MVAAIRLEYVAAFVGIRSFVQIANALLTERSITGYSGLMVRPRQFDRDKALDDAMRVFWAKGFAGTSTHDLLQAMGIGRQSLYNAFGDKRRLYLETLDAYLQGAAAAHLARLETPTSPLEGIEDLLVGLLSENDPHRGLGCMGVCSVGEFGTSDTDVTSLRNRAERLVSVRLVERVKEGQACGEIDPTIDPKQATVFVQMAINGLQVAARAGAKPSELATLATFAVDRLRRPALQPGRKVRRAAPPRGRAALEALDRAIKPGTT
jgi:TetR/AcrR family transcriptional repressor of nem operon